MALRNFENFIYPKDKLEWVIVDDSPENDEVDGAILAGNIPNSQTRLVQAWIEIHRPSLMADWDLAIDGKGVFPIDPLK